MKKVFILPIISVLLISLVGCGSNFKVINKGSNHESTNLNSDNPIDKKIALDDATDINVEIYAAEVSIKSYDGDEVKLSGELSEKSKGIDINKNNNKIAIVEEKDKNAGLTINSTDNMSKINILVPSKFKGNFKFEQGAGTADIDGIKVKDIDLTGGAGDLKCKNIKFDKLNLTSGVGEVDLNLSEKCGDIVIDGGVGKTNIKMTEVGGNLMYKGGVGSSNITIPENSPVKFITEKGVGECKVDAKTSGEQTYTFDLKVGVGSINIHN